MNIFRKAKIGKIALSAVGLTMAVMMVFGVATTAQAALTQSQVDAIVALLQSFGADQATISNVQTSLTGGTPTVTTPSTSSSEQCDFTRSLTIGSRDNADKDVTCLQNYLKSEGHFTAIATGYFGPITKTAVAAWQADQGVTPAAGYFGLLSRTKYNELMAEEEVVSSSSSSSVSSSSSAGSSSSAAATTTGLIISSAAQPADGLLAAEGAARLPFTKVTLTAGSQDVTVTGITVERTGQANDAVFAGVVLMNDTGAQLGIAKTFNSDHKATIGETVIIKAGTSQIFTVAGNMASTLDSYSGQVVSLSVIGISTSATVSGTLPVAGISRGVNSNLAIGSATYNISSFDPNTAQTKEIGTTGVRLAGIRITAGSAEDIRIKSIRWNQTGSAGSGDISNVVTMVDSVAYPTTVSSDGKFYAADFGSGVVIAKGNNIDVYVKADIVGGPDRTVFFDISKNTDIYVTGELYGYGITGVAASTAAASDTSSQFTTGTPFFDASRLTISAGSATTIQKSATVPAQNIAVNVANQPLGAFETDIKGEAINIAGITLTVASTTGSGAGLLTNVTIVDQNGSVKAGPVDATYTTALVQTVTFTDSITIPVGKMVYTVKGKVASTIGNGGTYIVSVTPSGWTTPTGNVTGNTITLSQGLFTLNTMTVKAAALAISIASDPVAQNITTGAQGFTFANYQLDATQSGEDVRFSSMVGLLGGGSNGFEGAYNNLASCQLWDSSTALNTGSNVINPAAGTASTTSANTFTFDTALIIPKGTIKSLALKCNLSSSADVNSTYQWGIADTAANITVTGVTSSNAVTETVTASNGQLMTVGAVSVVASKDSSSPSYAIASAGTTGVIAGVIKFRAANEAVTLQRVGLKLTNTASSSASDLVAVSLYDGLTKVGSAIFTGANTNATSTLNTIVTLPKDQDKTLTVKVDLANIGTSLSGTQGALIAVNIDTNNTNTQGIGQESGTTVNASGSTAFDGIRMFKSYPTFAKLALPSSTLITSTSDLYRFSVKADSKGAIGLYKLTINIATSSTPSGTSSTTLTNLKVMAYTDSGFSTSVSGFSPAGQLNDTIAGLVSSGNNDVLMTASTQGQDYLQIPAGLTYYFRVVGDVALTGGPTAGSVITNIQGDANYPILWLSQHMATSTNTSAFTDANGNDFIWSPNATTTSDTTHVDWTNGYFVSGLPSDNMDNAVLVK